VVEASVESTVEVIWRLDNDDQNCCSIYTLYLKEYRAQVLYRVDDHIDGRAANYGRGGRVEIKHVINIKIASSLDTQSGDCLPDRKKFDEIIAVFIVEGRT
jgi:hypothetical protein